jgi:hypothetical protein
MCTSSGERTSLVIVKFPRSCARRLKWRKMTFASLGGGLPDTMRGDVSYSMRGCFSYDDDLNGCGPDQVRLTVWRI